MDVISNCQPKIFKLFDLCISSNIETKTFLENLKLKCLFFGNLKLINQVNEDKIFNENENYYQIKDLVCSK